MENGSETNRLELDKHLLLVSAMECVASGMVITDRTGHIVWVNAAVCQMSGYTEEQLLGQRPSIFNSGKQTDEFYRILWETILSGRSWQGEVIERHREGHLYTVHEVVTPLLDASGAITHFTACQHGIHMREGEKEELLHMAHYDSLTGLPNRKLFFDILTRTLEHAAFEAHQVALMFIDLDHFKPVNDALGHYVGDLLLVAVAQRLRAAVRKTDTVARLGGDEFVVVLPSLSEPSIVTTLARSVVSKLRLPFLVEQEKIAISASIGISAFPRDGATAEALLMHADAAMYRAKAHGGKRFDFFEPR